MNEPLNPQPSPSRRTIVKGAAWAAPAIAMSVASPAFAASPVSVLTVKFTEPLYSATAGGQYLNPRVAATVWDASGPVENAAVTFTITPVDSTSGSESEGDEDDGGVDVVAAFGRIGGAPADTALSSATGLATPDVIYAGQAVGVLIVTARAVVIRDGKQQVATAETFIRISAITTKIVPFSAGYKGSGALGTGSKTNNPVPAAVAMPASAGSVMLLGAGLYRAGFALDDAGTVWSWGSDYYHNQAVRKDQWSPVPFAPSSMPKDIVQLEGTYYAMFALTSSGDVWGWGYNLEGQFADGSTKGGYRETPVRVPISGVKKLAGGHYNMHALLEDGTLVNWGYGAYGSLGNGNRAVNRVTTPTPVAGFPPGRTVVDVAGRKNGVSAVLDDGTVWSWGHNAYGQIGNGTTTHAYVPTQVAALADVKAKSVYANYWNVGVVLTDNTCRLWGKANYYNLGNGSTTNRGQLPVDPGLTNVESLSWGLETGHALLTDGSVRGWGYNGNYETGTGVRESRTTTPRVVPGCGRVKQIAQSQYSTYFLPA